MESKDTFVFIVRVVLGRGDRNAVIGVCSDEYAVGSLIENWYKREKDTATLDKQAVASSRSEPPVGGAAAQGWALLKSGSTWKEEPQPWPTPETPEREDFEEDTDLNLEILSLPLNKLGEWE